MIYSYLLGTNMNETPVADLMDVEAMEPVREAADLPGHGDRAGAGVLEVDGAGRLAASLQNTNCLDHGGGLEESGVWNTKCKINTTVDCVQ